MATGLNPCLETMDSWLYSVMTYLLPGLLTVELVTKRNIYARIRLVNRINIVGGTGGTGMISIDASSVKYGED